MAVLAVWDRSGRSAGVPGAGPLRRDVARAGGLGGCCVPPRHNYLMRLGMMMDYAGGFMEAVEGLTSYESAGLEIVFVPEAYSFDAVSQMGFIAARTDRLEIASGILPIYSRTPALTAMTAA